MTTTYQIPVGDMMIAITLRRGMGHPDELQAQAVKRVQIRLNELRVGLPLKEDGEFGAVTERAVKRFQELRGYLDIDGVVGPHTYASLFGDVAPLENAGVKDEPCKLVPWTAKEMGKHLGVFGYRPIGNGAIQREAAWEDGNLEIVSIPQLSGVDCGEGVKCRGKVLLHKKVADQWRAAFDAIQTMGLMHLILTFDGADCPRFIRGGMSLSNHAWAAAMDLNAEWNPMGRRPAPKGSKGSVVELVPVFAAYGIGWGGWWSNPDGMHFGVGKVV